MNQKERVRDFHNDISDKTPRTKAAWEKAMIYARPEYTLAEMMGNQCAMFEFEFNQNHELLDRLGIPRKDDNDPRSGFTLFHRIVLLAEKIK